MFGIKGENYSRIAGAVREGDVVTAHVSRLGNDGDSRKVYRPCIVLDVFEERGTGVPVGLMLLPCARMSHWNFPDKVRLRNPFGTRFQRMQSFAITNRVVVAPLTHRYIPGYHHVSNHLPDALYNRVVSGLHDTLDKNFDRVQIYGWDHLPRDWQSRRMKNALGHVDSADTRDMPVPEYLERLRSRLTSGVTALDDVQSPESVLDGYMNLRRVEQDFDLKPKLDAAGEAALLAAADDNGELPLEAALPETIREKAPPVLPDDIQVGAMVSFRIPQKARRDIHGHWQHPRVQNQHGLVWMVFRDRVTGHVGGVGVIPFETNTTQKDFSVSSNDGKPNTLPDWQHACLDEISVARANAPTRGRFMMNTLHLLPNTRKFLETRPSWEAIKSVSPLVMQELVHKRELALMNAHCFNRGFNRIPRDWLFEQAPVDRDGLRALQMPVDMVESLVFAPDLRRVQQALEYWQRENGLLPVGHFSHLPPLTVNQGRFVTAPRVT